MTAVRLREDEVDVARAEVEAVRKALGGGDYRDLLDALLDDLGDGEVEEGHIDELDRLLTLALQSGRVRALYGPGGEQAALQTYRRLPSGAAAAKSAEEVSAALGTLVGERLESVSVSAVGPGSFSLSLAAAGRELTVRLDRSGVRVASVGA